ncbi:serine/threonine-protein phosphatase with EF-hands 2-like [Carcharodon carcharias]|uniref:serine/threonine-protein phosphatase with EF-hands 2-like n=1 Tax=Carcharodon carcharias TaxID=13397 RepID=UPI001B7F1C56|nr:serine/threonine-protein phosphatase with EF-hands 2-like [Carcharodon carcharias]
MPSNTEEQPAVQILLVAGIDEFVPESQVNTSVLLLKHRAVKKKKIFEDHEIMGCGSSTVNTNSLKRTVKEHHCTAGTAIKAAILIQRWYRQYVARLEVRRRCTWSIFQSIEYAGEQDQIKLHNFFSYLMEHFTPASGNEYDHISHIFTQTDESSTEVEPDNHSVYHNIEISESYVGPQLCFPLTPAHVTTLLEAFKDKKQLHAQYVLQLLNETRKHLEHLPNINHVSTCYSKEITICGDLHGKLDDLFLIFYKNGLPSPEKVYVFNGDYVDRGKHSVEILLILFAFLLVYPKGVYLNRGNHEDYVINLSKKLLGQVVSIVEKVPELYKFCFYSRFVLTIFSASNYYEVGSNRGAYVKLGPDLVPHFVQYQVSQSTRKLTLRQRVSRVERSALGALRKKIFAHKSDLISAFEYYDKNKTGKISLNDWANALETILALGLPWRVLRSQLVPNTPKGLLNFYSWFDDLAIEKPIAQHIQPSLLEMLYRSRSDLETIFRIFDSDNSGLISFQEFQKTCKLLSSHLKIDISDKAIGDLARSMDFNKDGSIDINEFLEAFRLVDKSNY